MNEGQKPSLIPDVEPLPAALFGGAEVPEDEADTESFWSRYFSHDIPFFRVCPNPFGAVSSVVRVPPETQKTAHAHVAAGHDDMIGTAEAQSISLPAQEHGPILRL